VLRTFVVPHAPLLVDIPGRPHPLPDIPSLTAELDPRGNVVLVTPHGSEAGIYSTTRGDLNGFGLDIGTGTDRDADLGRALASTWGAGPLDEPLDHGAVVPLLLLPPLERVAVCALPQWTGQDESGPEEALAAADALGSALRTIAGVSDLDVVISAHTSAAISSRAPLTERPEGQEVDRAVVDALAEAPERLGAVPAGKWERAGSCGAGPFRVLSHLAQEPLEVLHHSAPFGVGYVVARSRG